jgi:hypothetical protein
MRRRCRRALDLAVRRISRSAGDIVLDCVLGFDREDGFGASELGWDFHVRDVLHAHGSKGFAVEHHFSPTFLYAECNEQEGLLLLCGAGALWGILTGCSDL